MFSLSLVRSLVLSAIKSDKKCSYYVHKTSSSYIILTVSVNSGTVLYCISVIYDDTNQCTDILLPSLDDVLSYGKPEPFYNDVQLLQMYANHYSLNKSELAKDFGISRPTLNKYLSGTIPLPLIYKKYIALDFNIPEEFLDFEYLHSEKYCPLTKQVLNNIPF